MKYGAIPILWPYKVFSQKILHKHKVWSHTKYGAIHVVYIQYGAYVLHAWSHTYSTYIVISHTSSTHIAFGHVYDQISSHKSRSSGHLSSSMITSANLQKLKKLLQLPQLADQSAICRPITISRPMGKKQTK